MSKNASSVHPLTRSSLLPLQEVRLCLLVPDSIRRVNILFIFWHAMPINVVCCARCHLAFPFPCVLSRKPTLVSRFVFRLDVFRSVRTFLYDLLTSVLPEVKPVLP